MKPKSMTVTDRDQMRSLLLEHHNSKVAEITAGDPEWKNRIEARKRKIAIGKLGIAKQVAALESLEDQIRELTDHRDELELKIKRRMPLEESHGSRYRSCPDHQDMCTAIGNIADQVHDQQMIRDSTGKKVLSLQHDHRNRLAQLSTCETREDVVTAKILDSI